MNYKTQNPKNKRIIWVLGIGILVAVIAAVALLMMLRSEPIQGEPTLTVETPQKISRSSTQIITLDVLISDLGDAIYPAASMSIRFDPSRLEFMGVQEGNVFVGNTENSIGLALPEWSYNVSASNEMGQINIMYLDMTGGDYAFRRELLAENDNVVLRLQFRLRGSVRAGDVMELVVEDAVFAAFDEAQSLALTTDTLKIKNSKMVIVE
jgi:hypothetical protein